MKEVPCVTVRQMVRDFAATLMGQEELRPTPLTANDVEKLHAYQISFSEMVFGVQTSLFEQIHL